MNACYDCGKPATRVLAVPDPHDQDYYCDLDGSYQDAAGYPTKPVIKTLYAIAIDTSPLDYSDRVYKTRFWGSDNKTYVWTSMEAATDYMINLDDGWFTGKGSVMGGESHIVDDVYVMPVSDERLAEFEAAGGVTYPNHTRIEPAFEQSDQAFFVKCEGYPPDAELAEPTARREISR